MKFFLLLLVGFLLLNQVDIRWSNDARWMKLFELFSFLLFLCSKYLVHLVMFQPSVAKIRPECGKDRAQPTIVSQDFRKCTAPIITQWLCCRAASVGRNFHFAFSVKLNLLNKMADCKAFNCVCLHFSWAGMCRRCEVLHLLNQSSHAIKQIMHADTRSECHQHPVSNWLGWTLRWQIIASHPYFAYICCQRHTERLSHVAHTITSCSTKNTTGVSLDCFGQATKHRSEEKNDWFAYLLLVSFLLGAKIYFSQFSAVVAHIINWRQCETRNEWLSSVVQHRPRELSSWERLKCDSDNLSACLLLQHWILANSQSINPIGSLAEAKKLCCAREWRMIYSRSVLPTIRYPIWFYYFIWLTATETYILDIWQTNRLPRKYKAGLSLAINVSGRITSKKHFRLRGKLDKMGSTCWIHECISCHAVCKIRAMICSLLKIRWLRSTNFFFNNFSIFDFFQKVLATKFIPLVLFFYSTWRFISSAHDIQNVTSNCCIYAYF